MKIQWMGSTSYFRVVVAVAYIFWETLAWKSKRPSIGEKPAEAVEVVTRSIGCADGSLAMHRDGCMANARLSFRSLAGLVGDTAFDPG
jgi:hypothetical protein